ncbi:hypothetical protein Tco_1200178 [Tanacetum coccineum]
MTKVIKREFEKLEDLNDEDVSLTCDTSIEVFNKEFNRMSGMDDDLFTYEVKIANIPCDSNKDDESEQQMSHEANDDMGYDPSDVAFTEWFLECVMEENRRLHEDLKHIQTYLLRTLRDSRLMKNIRMIGSMNVTEMYHGLMRNHRLTLEFGLNLHHELKEEDLRNKAIMEGLISDDKSRNNGWRIWESHEITYHDHDELECENETHDERQELYEAHELPDLDERKEIDELVEVSTSLEVLES